MMTPERWQQLKGLLADALEKESSERGVYLDRVFAGDPTLRSDLERLLVAEEEAGTVFLDTPPHHADDDAAEDAKTLIGLRIGAYQVVEKIGSGGMGEVYRAFRADDQYRKEVAIKLVRYGQESAFVVARFKQERQILAGLDHPNIARLLDGATTEQGVPYFVMELIAGEPIDDFCKAHDLPTN